MPTFDIGFGHFWLDLRFTDLQDAIALAENLMSKHRVDFDTMVEVSASSLSDNQLEDLHLEWLRIKDRFPQVLRRALFMVSYARIEALLNDLCHAAKKERSLSLALGDLTGMGITRAKRYLTKVADLRDPFQGEDWRLLKGCNHLRNCLIHGDGHPTPGLKEDNGLLSFIDEQPLLKLDKYGYVVIESGFCEKVVDAAHRLFKQFPFSLIVIAWRYSTEERLEHQRDSIQLEVGEVL